MRRVGIWSLLLVAALGTAARGEVVWALDGHIYEGATGFSLPHAVVVTPPGGKPATVPFEQVLLATISPGQIPAPAPDAKPVAGDTLPKGILLKNGTFLAGVWLRSADAKTMQITHKAYKGSLALADVARIITVSLSPTQAAKLNDRIGVMTQSGDFTEGEIQSIDGRHVKVSTVLLGIVPFVLGGMPDSVCVVNLRKVQKEDTRFVVTLVEGSTLNVDMLEYTATDQVFATERILGRVKLHPSEILSIRAGKAAARALTDMWPREATGMKDYRPGATSAFDPNNGVNVPTGVVSALVLPAGATVTYGLEKGYSTLVCRIGVPHRTPEKATVKFSFLADGKEVAPPRVLTRKDRVTVITFPVKDVKNLVIKVESSEPAAVGAVGDALLIPAGK